MQFLCITALVLGVGAVAWARPIPPPDPVNVDLLGGWEVEITIESGNNSIRPFAEDCKGFCSLSYPEHTYPEPENFKACTTGCRAAQLDAFIVWPVKAEVEKCEHACDEMYSVEDQRFACTTGCKTPTIDSTFPNRSHLYSENNATSEMGLLLPPVEDTFSYLLDSFFLPRNPIVFDDLAEHAQNMEMLVVPYLRSDVTILTNDGLYTYREYSYDNGDAVAVDMDPTPPPQPVYEDIWGYQYQYHPHSSSSCIWPLHRAVLHRFLTVLSVGLLIAALTMCCLSSCGDGNRKTSPPNISSVKTSPPPVSAKKAPYDLASEFILPEKVHLSNYGHKITLL